MHEMKEKEDLQNQRQREFSQNVVKRMGKLNDDRQVSAAAV